jgi:hypothetical protein
MALLNDRVNVEQHLTRQWSRHIGPLLHRIRNLHFVGQACLVGQREKGPIHASRRPVFFIRLFGGRPTKSLQAGLAFRTIEDNAENTITRAH